MEFIGLARRLWRQIDAEYQIIRPEQQRLIDGLRSLAPRRGFRSKPIGPALRAFTSGWRALPATARLALKLELLGDRLTVAEVRVVPSRMRMAGWDEPELALRVRLTQVEFAHRHLSVKRTPLGDACLHALARRYERCPNRSDDAVLADLFALAEAYPERALTRGDFNVPVGGGAWVGVRVLYQNRPFMTARTYIDHLPYLIGCSTARDPGAIPV